MSNIETGEVICVDIGNALDVQPEVVQNTVAGLAYLTGALLEAGQTGLATERSSHQMKGTEAFFNKVNKSLGNRALISQIQETHPDLMTMVEETIDGASSYEFKGFLQGLGAMDHAYRLVPTSDDPNHFTLTFLGFD